MFWSAISCSFSFFIRNSLVEVVTLPIAIPNGRVYLSLDCRNSDMGRSVRIRVVMEYLMKE